MNVQWVRIRSWHIVRNPSRVPNSYRTLCGRNGDGPPLDDRPDGATCESCYRASGLR